MATSQSNPERSGVALFDLDGTLIPWDCQLLFCHWIVRRHTLRRFYLPLFAAFAPLTPLLGDTGMKRVFLSYLWRFDRESLQNEAKEFAKTWFPQACYPELLSEISRHRRAGRLTVLASASPEFYVKEIGKVLGFDLSLGTPVGIRRTVPLFPDLVNHKGEAKVHRLRRVLDPAYFDGEKLRDSHGYSDSEADLPMLALCDRVTMVNPCDGLAAEGEARGWGIVRPERPWHSRAAFYRQCAGWLTGTAEVPVGVTSC